MTGPLDRFTTSRSDDMEVESSGGSGDFAAASLAACWARACGVQTVPVIAAAAPITALRMMNVRRSMLSGRFDSLHNSGNILSFLSEDDVLISAAWWLMVGRKFSIALVSFALDCVDVPLRARLYIRCVPFVRIDVHREFEIRIHSHQHVAKN
jgi:hypothetical protein